MKSILVNYGFVNVYINVFFLNLNFCVIRLWYVLRAIFCKIFNFWMNDSRNFSCVVFVPKGVQKFFLLVLNQISVTWSHCFDFLNNFCRRRVHHLVQDLNFWFCVSITRFGRLGSNPLLKPWFLSIHSLKNWQMLSFFVFLDTSVSASAIRVVDMSRF